jgi:glycosyltransferase involved in cell wall biosynthesis
MCRDRVVLHIITSLSSGGAEQALFRLVANQSEGFKHYVICLRGRDFFTGLLESQGVSVLSLNIKGIFSGAKGLVAAVKWRRKIKSEVTIGWMYHGSLVATFVNMATFSRERLIWNFRHSLHDIHFEKWSTQWALKICRILSARPEMLVYNSQVARLQHRAFGIDAGKTVIIPNGFDHDVLCRKPAVRKSLREKLGVSAGDFVFGHVARYHPMKDHQLFIKAAIDVANARSDVAFLLIGRGVDVLNSAITSQIPAELLDRFILAGEQRSVSDYMNVMDAMVLSSAWGEGFPNVLAEAMCHELPCITTDVGDSRYILGLDEWVIAPRDGDSLEDRMMALVSASQADRTAIGQNLRQRVVDHFSAKRMVEAYSLLLTNNITQT